MKPSVLLLNDRLRGGGSERILHLIAADLAGHGAQLTVWAPEGDREDLVRCYPAGTRFRRLPFWLGVSPRFSLRWFWQRSCRVLFERFLLRLRRWDMVIAMKEGPSMILAAQLRAGKRLAWIHTDFNTLHWTRFEFHSDAEELACFSRFDEVVCVSETVRGSVLDTIGDPGNLRVLRNPIDVSSIERLSLSPAPDAEKPADGPLFVAVGRLAEEKRFSLLLDVCRELSRDFPFTLWIVGDGPERAALQRQLADSDLENIRLLGHRDNPYPYIARADWLISASESESYGLTVQEALILGVPVLACACGGVAESLDPRFGILTGLSREELAAGLRRVLEQPELREEKRRNIACFYDRSALWEPRLEAIRARIGL